MIRIVSLLTWVAAAARQAKKEYRKFTPTDVTPEMIAPELHVYPPR